MFLKREFWKRKNKTTTALANQVTFEYIAPEANHVELVGDFTNWQKTPLPLAKDKIGRWYTKVRLKPGSYQYRYLIDGAWVTDSSASSTVDNSFGTQNSIVSVLEEVA